MLADLALAVRTLRRRPGFAAAAIATLALGIGASTAIFSVAYGVSLRPLPYPEPDRLIRIYEANPANGKLKEDASEAAFHAWREGAPAIASAALYAKRVTRFLADAERTPLTMSSVSPAFFAVLGVSPLLGEGFKPESAYTPRTASEEVMLSHGAWLRLFGGARDVIGKPVVLAGIGDDDAFRIVGVLPEDSAFDRSVDLWMPSNIPRIPIPRIVRTWRYDQVVARLRPDATIDDARAQLEGVARRLAAEFPAQHGGWTVTIEPLHDSIVGNFARATWMLLAAVAVVLLVACLNVGGLLAARAISRERETAVRFALGAGPWRLLRHWFAEAAVLCAAAAGLGLFVAWSGVALLKAAAPPGIPRLDAIALDTSALLVSLGAALLAVAIFTVAPAAQSRMRPAGGLRAASVSAGAGRTRQTLRAALTMAQCAGAAALVVVALMLARSFVKLTAVDLGWEPARVLTLNAAPPIPRELRRPWFRLREWSERVVARLEAAPGVEGVAISTHVPLAPQPYLSTVARGRGKGSTDTTRWPGVEHHITDNYFDVMGIRVLEGRRFDAGDRYTEAQMIDSAARPERGPVIVSESTAQALWPGERAIGQALWLPDIDNVSWREVVGVVEDIQFHAVGEQPAMHVFVPWSQYTTTRPRFIVRGTASAAVVRDAIRSVESGTYIDQVATLDALVASATAQPRFTTRLVSAFGALALLLAAVGIYGTLSYIVGARTREIGVRLALGASRRAIVAIVVRHGVIPAAVGGLTGLAMAAAAVRTFRALLFGVEPVDPASFGAGGAALLLVALVAALGPALRASRVDPASALRAE